MRHWEGDSLLSRRWVWACHRQLSRFLWVNELLSWPCAEAEKAVVLGRRSCVQRSALEAMEDSTSVHENGACLKGGGAVRPTLCVHKITTRKRKYLGNEVLAVWPWRIITRSRKCLGSEVPMCEHGESPPETGKLGKLIKGNQGQKLRATYKGGRGGISECQ